MDATPRLRDAEAGAREEAAALEAAFGELAPQQVIERAAVQFWTGGLVAISSFGADSAALLHMIAEIDRSLPVIFLDTGKHFDETLDYRDALIDDLGLQNVEIVKPDGMALSRADPDGLLHSRDADACCHVRKVAPMARAIAPYRAWFTGRKQFQASTRRKLPAFEAADGRIRINPLARWTTADLAGYMRAHRLRENPLVAYGYLSIGCFPCTSPVKPGEDARSGRWAGQIKTECGIHLPGLTHALAGASFQETPGQ